MTFHWPKFGLMLLYVFLRQRYDSAFVHFHTPQKCTQYLRKLPSCGVPGLRPYKSGRCWPPCLNATRRGPSAGPCSYVAYVYMYVHTQGLIRVQDIYIAHTWGPQGFPQYYITSLGPKYIVYSCMDPFIFCKPHKNPIACWVCGARALTKNF